jgi:phospho-N-acetylmuramoyl-pentapeptide-transferase
MIYNLYTALEAWLKLHDLGFFRVFSYVSFRAVLAIILSFLMVVAVARPVIRWLLRQKIGDNPEFHHKDLNQIMRQKANTPTMGGIMISGAILLNTLFLADLRCFYVVMALLCLCWLSTLGMIDDWLKLTSARRNPGSREGLKFWEKVVCQLGLAVLLGIFVHHHGINKSLLEDPAIRDMSHSLTLPFSKSWVWVEHDKVVPNVIVLGEWAFVLAAAMVITFWSNAVNLTDGMDGLAAGVTAVCALAFLALAYIAGVEQHAKYLLVPYIPLSGELAVVAGAMAGSCLGFLWFNCSPAQVFMGDTGSLPLGGLLGYIAVVTRQEFLLFIIGGVFMLEALSVMLQVGYFRFSGGRRIFRCAPVHHHFHLGGWTEQQVVVRFWLLSAIFAAIALATLKLR